jgi:hypothetical protein
MHDMFPHASATLFGCATALDAATGDVHERAGDVHERAGEMNRWTKPLATEFIGTFALIFIGAGTGTALGGGDIPVSPSHTV